MIRLLLVCAIAFGGYWGFMRPSCGTKGAVACPPPALEEGVGTTLDAKEVCRQSGYLCYQRASGFMLARWPLDKGRIRVRMRLPEFTDEARAKALREAATEGIMAWDGHPFPIVVDSGKFTLRFWDIGVIWTEGLFTEAAGQNRSGYRIDGKRLDYMVDGLAIVVPPFLEGDAELLARVRAVASHEMGHALGLMHSDSPDDIMYFQLAKDASKSRVSERDLATVEALYALPNGAMVR